MKNKIIITMLCGVFFAAGCIKTEIDANTTDLVLNFQAKVGSADFACGTTYSGVGTASTQLAARDFRFYVHDVKLVKSDGSEVSVSLTADNTWQYKNVALLDFENGTGGCAATTGPTSATNSQVKGTVAVTAGDKYSKIKFTLGIPSSLNHLDVSNAPAPLNVAALYWSWTSGRKAARLDFLTSGGGAYDATAFNIHIGSTSCTQTGATQDQVTCTTPNRPEVTLNIPETYQTGLSSLSSLRIMADVKELLRDLNLNTADQGAPAGCMSGTTDPECRSVMPRLGIAYTYTGTTNATRDATNGTSYGAVSGGHATQSSTQSFFRIE